VDPGCSGLERSARSEGEVGKAFADETVRRSVRMELIGKRQLFVLGRTVEIAPVDVMQIGIIRRSLGYDARQLFPNRAQRQLSGCALGGIAAEAAEALGLSYWTRTLHVILLAVPFVATLLLILRTPWALLGLLALPLAIRANAPLRSGGQGMALIPALRDTGLAMLVWGAATAVALSLA